ncbi:hypothetical protein CIPAW_03G260400 [Carya illinoinensis]|uniref:RRM domain-containing protein n=1 Tax=Carya illinoinensis TaxID=32201 RepID=A0A8T1R731_CARIL|nr:hypothetical protein CIPAW_03G260400 [Carya illinoinensis]
MNAPDRYERFAILEGVDERDMKIINTASFIIEREEHTVGNILRIQLHRDQNVLFAGEPRGFGFVKYRYAEVAVDAKQQLNHTIIGGCEIRIVFAEENRKNASRNASRVSLLKVAYTS